LLLGDIDFKSSITLRTILTDFCKLIFKINNNLWSYILNIFGSTVPFM